MLCTHCLKMSRVQLAYLAHADSTLMLGLADLLRQVVQVQQLGEGAGDLQHTTQ